MSKNNQIMSVDISLSPEKFKETIVALKTWIYPKSISWNQIFKNPSNMKYVEIDKNYVLTISGEILLFRSC